MSTPGRRVTRASSRQASETSSLPPTDFPDTRSSRAGSPNKKRNEPTTKKNQAYGSKSAPAAAQKKGAGGDTVGGIKQSLRSAQAQFAEPSSHGQLGAVEEEEDDEEEIAGRPDPTIQHLGHNYENDDFVPDALPLDDSSAAQRQTTLSDSDRHTDPSSQAIYLTPKYYMAIATFLGILVWLFLDIYRGPLLGSRLDFYKRRHVIGNATFTESGAISAIEARLRALEHGSDNDLLNLKHRVNAFETELQDFAGTLAASRTRWPINYFSTRHSPIVQPHLTSPTWEGLRRCDPDGIIGRLRLLWYPYEPACPGGEFSSSPSTVFGPWTEDSGPSWCAAPGDGKLQITTFLSAPMTPTELVVEFPPSSSEIVPKKVPAPKEFELWMAVRDDAVRESIGEAAEVAHGPFSSGEDTYGNRALPREFVPIGRWTYDYPAGHPTQIFRPHIDLTGTQTHTLVVRVNSNWANNPFTCLYRLRMHGINRHPEATS
ncbi:MAG: hypothetical protein LQ350_000413 [Teloschistes chrysophthalmus]|nr:MAG: hypothetical protein LQ350_000413 [Niorma chrysophthalma]